MPNLFTKYSSAIMAWYVFIKMMSIFCSVLVYLTNITFNESFEITEKGHFYTERLNLEACCIYFIVMVLSKLTIRRNPDYDQHTFHTHPQNSAMANEMASFSLGPYL